VIVLPKSHTISPPFRPAHFQFCLEIIFIRDRKNGTLNFLRPLNRKIAALQHPRIGGIGEPENPVQAQDHGGHRGLLNE
jgi:hypothetical protein